MKQHSAKNKNTTFKPLWLIISVLALALDYHAITNARHLTFHG